LPDASVVRPSSAQLLGLSRYELDGFLKAHGVFLEYSKEDLEREAILGERLLRKREVETAAGRGA
jgi:hypothetical protein